MADRRLLVWTFASFHVAGLTLGFVLPAYVSGGLSDVLPGLGTVPGVVGYAYLWTLSYLATRWVLTDDALDAALAGPVEPVLLRGSAGGGLVGLGALLGPLLLLAVPDLLGGANPVSTALIAVIGSGVAVAVGTVVGLAFALIEVAAVRIAGRLVAPAESTPPTAASESRAVESGPAGEEN